MAKHVFQGQPDGSR